MISGITWTDTSRQLFFDMLSEWPASQNSLVYLTNQPISCVKSPRKKAYSMTGVSMKPKWEVTLDCLRDDYTDPTGVLWHGSKYIGLFDAFNRSSHDKRPSVVVNGEELICLSMDEDPNDAIVHFTCEVRI